MPINTGADRRRQMQSKRISVDARKRPGIPDGPVRRQAVEPPVFFPCRATAMAGDASAREVKCIDSIQTPCLVWLLATVL